MPPSLLSQVTARPDGSNGCGDGVFAASLAFDKAVGRFIVTAICGDFLRPRILLATSTSESVVGFWNLYSAPADNIPTSWDCPDPTTWGYPDYAQVRRGCAAGCPAGEGGKDRFRPQRRAAIGAAKPAFIGYACCGL